MNERALGGGGRLRVCVGMDGFRAYAGPLFVLGGGVRMELDSLGVEKPVCCAAVSSEAIQPPSR